MIARQSLEPKIGRHFDFTMLLLIVLLLAYGLALIYSATLEPMRGGIDGLVYRQAIYGAVGLILIALLTWFDYRVLANLAPVLYVLAAALLLSVFAIGRITHGSQRWISLPFFDLQPSEAAKLLLIIVLAKFVADREDEMWRFRHVLTSLGMTLLLSGMVLIQPDLGTATMLLAIWAGIIFAGGLRPLHGGILVGGALALAPLSWFLLHDYQRRRLMVFLDPNLDPTGEGYNVIQALTSVGSGGWLGRGFTSGTQSQLHFLRVKYSDFIFSVLAEELGFVGCMLLFALIIALLLRVLRVAMLAQDSFGRLLSVGVLSLLFAQTFVNVAMNIGLLPVTGVTLPFISYGGSSLLTILAGIGLLQSVVVRHRRFEF
mgnify:CR=1 FL=1